MQLKLSKNERDLLLNLCKVSAVMYGSENVQRTDAETLAHEIKARQYSHLAVKLAGAA